MTHFLKSCWDTILQKQAEIAGDPKVPLVYLEEPCAACGLATFPAGEHDAAALPPIASISPTFKDLTEENLLALRVHLYHEQELDTVALWAETLMRFCEVRYSTLKKRAYKKCQTASRAQLHMLHLAAFLLDYGRYANDLRFFNTVLKLCDLAWVMAPKKIPALLDKTGDDCTVGLFQVRILLIKAYLFEKLDKEVSA